MQIPVAFRNAAHVDNMVDIGRIEAASRSKPVGRMAKASETSPNGPNGHIWTS